MLAYVLAFAIAIGSFGIYMAAFFFPEIHRKNDFVWSGIGLFYALVIWIFARRITGGLLLGHIASVALLGWFGWQTFTLRRQIVPVAQQTPVPSASDVKATVEQKVGKISLPQRLGQLQRGLGGMFSGVKNKAQQTINKNKPQDTTSATASPAQIIDAFTEEAPTPATKTAEPVDAKVTDVISTIEIKPVEPVDTTQAQAVPPNPPSWEIVEAAQSETEDKSPLPVQENTPDTELTPPVSASTEDQDTSHNPPAS
jgi:Ycf66 protein N-terminus